MNIIAVLILYRCDAKDAKTLNSLIWGYNQEPAAFKNFKLILYDNGPSDQSTSLNIPFEFQYIHDLSNRGLAVAYNYALNNGVKNCYDWLLLLDQDSSLPVNFLGDISYNANKVIKDVKIMAVVPKMYYNGFLFSPSKVLYGGVHRPIDLNHTGTCDFDVFAIGSGSTVRISFLEKIGGFNEMFWLDCLDRWLYLTIKNSGGTVFVTDIMIEHDLSVLDYNLFLNEKRYQNILKYETLFMKLYKSKFENYVYYLRLIKRSVTFYMNKKNRNYSSLTLSHLKDVLFNKEHFQKDQYEL